MTEDISELHKISIAHQLDWICIEIVPCLPAFGQEMSRCGQVTGRIKVKGAD